MESKSDGEAQQELWSPGVSANIHASWRRKVGCERAPNGAHLIPKNRPTLWRRTTMSTSNIRRTLSAALMALALGGVIQVSYGVGETAGETPSVLHKRTAQSAPGAAAVEPSRADYGSPVTLYVEDPNGKALQLVYVAGTGWKYGGSESRDHAGSSLFRKIAFWSKASAPAASDIVQNDEPLTVFIDGPSGFTYVWDRDGGWRFVGTLTQRKS